MSELVPRKMVPTLEAFHAKLTAGVVAQEVPFFRMFGLHVSCKVLPRNEGSIADTAYGIAWAMPAYVVTALVSVSLRCGS